jgi:hypothetical protein
METDKSGRPIVFHVYEICIKKAYFLETIFAQRCELADGLKVMFLDSSIVILLAISILLLLLFHV